MSEKAVYRRILLKLSGEALMGEFPYGIDPKVVRSVASEIKTVFELGVQIGVVVGGGNIFRGLSESAKALDRTVADHMGMLATVMNSLALQAALEAIGIPTRVLSAIEMRAISEPYIQRRAIRHLEKGRLVIFAAGTGNTFFSTDTAAALRAAEIKADVLLKATKVEGIYEADPIKNPNAKKYEKLSYQEALTQNLKVMDATAIAICRDNTLPVIVFSMLGKENLKKIICGSHIGTSMG